MPSLLDYFRPRSRLPDPFEPFNSRVTYYAPGPDDRMEGGFETSQPNPQTGKRAPSTLDDVRLGTSPFVTLAGDPSRYGQTVKMGPLTYTSPIDQKSYTLPDVTGYVHDTGSAFKGRPDKLDVATGDFRGWSPQQASAFVTADAGRRTVTPLSGDEADRAMRPIGLPEQWRATGEGESPTDTAIASGPPQGRKMPESLLDMFQPRNSAGEPMGLGDAIASQRQGLIGLGLGLMSPAWQGQSVIGNALQGYQQGAAQDATTAARAQALAHQKTQDARQAAMDRFNMGLREREFAQSQLTPYQKMQADLERAKGTPQEQQVADFYRNQLDAGPPQTREIFDPTLGRNVVQEWDSRSKSYKTATQGGGSTATAPADPFTTPGAGRVYGQGGNYTTPAPAPSATGTQGQPVLPARKPLTAHEQTAIDEADKSVMANRGVIGTLQDAKRLSKTAFSGLYPMQRAEVSANIPDSPLLPGSNQPAKDTLLLNNAVISQAVDQLKTVFGGNPSEGERKILLDLAGSMNSPDDVRQKIYDKAIELANDRLALNERRAREIRGGTYYNPGGGAQSATGADTGGSSGPMSEARDAIKRGAPRAAVIERLAKSGIRFNPKDLD